MKISAKGVAFIGGNEGFSSKFYLDPVGIPTIGYGFTWRSKIFRDWWLKVHKRKMRRGDTISKSDAQMILSVMINQEYGPPVNAKFVSQPLHVLDAAKSMTYNCGYGSLKWKWAQAIAQGRLTEGCNRWRNTATTARGRRLPGLVRRRKEEANIAQYNRWPKWLKVTKRDLASPPETNVYSEDIKQAQKWLKALGFDPGMINGKPTNATRLATLRFQRQHRNLKDDGTIGPATLAALQRSIDLKKQAAERSGVGAVAVGAGASDYIAGASGFGSYLLLGGVLVAVVLVGWLAWNYRDEINIAVRSLRSES